MVSWTTTTTAILTSYLIQGEMLGSGKTIADADQPPQKGSPLQDRLYRNDLVVAQDGTRTLSFKDVTERSGIRADGYGVGITTADYDNDGWVDILLTNFGHNQLWRNKGDGSFEEVIGAPASSRHAGAAKRELQCSLPRRVPECPLVSDARGCSAPDRDLAPRLQPRPASQFPRGTMRKVYRQEEGSNHVR